MTKYGQMTPDELVDHFIDENGLADFIELQQQGIAPDDWNWVAISRHLGAFSRGYLTFSPEYLAGLYAMQVKRRPEVEEVAA